MSGNETGIMGTVSPENDQDRDGLSPTSRLQRNLSTRCEFTQAIIKYRDPKILFEEICNLSVEKCGFKMAWAGYLNPETKEVKAIAFAGKTEPYLSNININLELKTHQTGPAGMAIRTGKSVVVNDIEHDPRMAPWCKDALNSEFRSMVVLPFIIMGEVQGVFSLYANEPDFFDEQEISLLEEIVSLISIVFESSEHKEQWIRAVKAKNKIDSMYMALVEQASDSFFVHNFEGKIIEVNQQACKSLGYSKEELLDMTIMDVELDFDLHRAQKEWAKIEPGVPFTLYGHQRRKNGSVFPVEVRFGCSIINGEKLFLGLVRDISEREQAIRALKESEQRFRWLIDAAPTGIVISDEHEETYFVNKKFTELTGYTMEDMPSVEEWWQLAYPDENYRNQLKETWQNALRYSRLTQSEIEPIECRIRRKDGNYRFLEIGLVSSDQLNIITFFDVTDRKKAEEIIKESELKYRRIAENMTDIVYITDLNFDLTYVSPSVRKILGFSEEDFYKLSLEEKYSQKSVEIIYALRDEQMDLLSYDELEKDVQWTREVEAYRKDGKSIWLTNRIKLLMDDKDYPIGYLGVMSEVTERKKAEIALEETEDRIRYALETSQIGAWVMNLEDHTVVRSLLHDMIFGYGEMLPEWRYEMFLDIVHPDDHEHVITVFNQSIEEKKELNFECRILRLDGQERWIWIAGRHVFQESGESNSLAGIIQDITERKHSERESKQLSKIIEESLNEIFLFNAETLLFTQVNRAALNNLGYTINEMKQMTPVDIKPKFTKEEFVQLIEPLKVGEKEELHFETVHKRKDNSIYNIEVHLQLMDFEGEKLFAAIISDITERKSAEAKLNEQLQELQRWYKITLGREERILELKKEVNSLLGEYGKPPRYESVLEVQDE